MDFNVALLRKIQKIWMTEEWDRIRMTQAHWLQEGLRSLDMWMCDEIVNKLLNNKELIFFLDVKWN